MRDTADVTAGYSIAVKSQSISDISAINHIVAFYDIHGRKVLFFYFVPDTLRDMRLIHCLIVYIVCRPLLYKYIHKYKESNEYPEWSNET
jgi:hypothetical protein